MYCVRGISASLLLQHKPLNSTATDKETRFKDAGCRCVLQMICLHLGTQFISLAKCTSADFAANARDTFHTFSQALAQHLTSINSHVGEKGPKLQKRRGIKRRERPGTQRRVGVFLVLCFSHVRDSAVHLNRRWVVGVSPVALRERATGLFGPFIY